MDRTEIRFLIQECARVSVVGGIQQESDVFFLSACGEFRGMEERTTTFSDLRLTFRIFQRDFDNQPAAAITATADRLHWWKTGSAVEAALRVMSCQGVFISSEHRLVFDEEAILQVRLASQLQAACAAVVDESESSAFGVQREGRK